ncbi:MAG TPA: porin [Candidatus Competibacter sp.]|nr:porin [Candidatus Competibacter sp.]
MKNFAVISKLFNFIIVCLFIFCLHFSGQAQAIELTDDIQVHGFLSQGYFLTSDNQLFGSSDSGGSLDFTEAGLNASWSPFTDLRFGAQALFRRAGPRHEHDIELDFGLLDYTILSTADSRFGVRLGRVKNPYGFYSETRDVLFTRPTIILPQSIYADATRDLALSADGGLFYGEYRNDWGNLSLDLEAMIPRGESLDTEIVTLGADFPGNTYSKLSYIGRLIYDLGDGRYRMAITAARLDTRYKSKLLPPDDLLSGKEIFKPLVVSMQYNQEKLSITSEYAIRSSTTTGFGSEFDNSITGEGYYLQALYRFSDDLYAVGRYDAFYVDRKDKNGKKFQDNTGYPAHSRFAKDWTIGLRYYVNPSFLLAAEYHYINGTAWLLPLQENLDPFDLEQHWHLFALAAGLRF